MLWVSHTNKLRDVNFDPQILLTSSARKPALGEHADHSGLLASLVVGQTPTRDFCRPHYPTHPHWR
jgi:hypothetical protein